jgi:hypothetical protein
MYVHTNIQSTLMQYVTMCVVLQQMLLNAVAAGLSIYDSLCFVIHFVLE